MISTRTRCGFLVTLSLAVVVGLAVWPVQAAPAPPQDAVPAGLNLVPKDAPGFMTVNVTEMWKQPAVKELLKLLEAKQANWKDEFQKSVGVDATNIERVTVILDATLNEEPVVVVTTIKAFNKAAVQAAITPNAAEQKTAKGKLYTEGKGNRSLALVSDRVFVWGLTTPVLDLIDRPADQKVEGSLSNALQAAAKQPAVAWVNLAAYAKEIQKELPPTPEVKSLEPLFQAKTAFLTLVSSEETRADLQMTFETADQAKEGEKAAKTGLELGRQLVGKGREEIGRELGRAREASERMLMQQIDVLLEKIDAGLKAGEVVRKEQALNVTLRGKISAGDLAAIVATGFFTIRSLEAPPPKQIP
jgi:hypothetical protein